MKISVKSYRKLKIRKSLKSGNLFYIFNGVYQKSQDWVKVEQELHSAGFCYHKILNKLSVKIFKGSTFKHTHSLINGLTFFIKSKETILTNIDLLNKFESFLFNLLAIKFNNKTYGGHQFTKLLAIEFFDENQLSYKTNLVKLKNGCNLKISE